MGIESWREYCDCIECYQTYIVLSKDINDITKEEFDYISAIELPTGQEYTKEVKAKFNEVKKHFEAENKSQSAQQLPAEHNEAQSDYKSKGQTKDYKKYNYGYEKNKTNKTQYKNR